MIIEFSFVDNIDTITVLIYFTPIHAIIHYSSKPSVSLANDWYSLVCCLQVIAMMLRQIVTKMSPCVMTVVREKPSEPSPSWA